MNASRPVVVARRWSEMSRDEVFEMMLLRTEVFYVEQRIDEQDFDAADRDERTLHLWISDDDGMAAYARVTALEVPEYGADRTFGRVVVRAERRGSGLARRLVREVVERCGHAPMTIHAQSYVVGLYKEFGFTVMGEPFIEAGLLHDTMVRPAR